MYGENDDITTCPNLKEWVIFSVQYIRLLFYLVVLEADSAIMGEGIFLSGGSTCRGQITA